MSISSGTQMDVNLVFVAAPDDAIWTSLDSLSLLGADSDADEAIIGSNALTVAKGDSNGDSTLGNVKFSFAPPLKGDGDSFNFSRVALTLKGDSRPVIVNVGSWQAQVRSDQALVETTGESVIAAPKCGPMQTTIKNLTDRTLDVSGLQTEAPGVRFKDVKASGPLPPGGEADVAYDVVCDDSADFRIVTPRVLLSGAGTDGGAYLDTLTIGLTGITTETIERIQAR